MKNMAKLEDEIKTLTETVNKMANEISQVKFSIMRLQNDLSNFEGSGGSIEPGQVVTAAVDLGPIEERLDLITKGLIGKEDINRLEKRLEDLSSERIKESQETLSRVTALFQSGLEMVKIESTLQDLKSLLEETILQ
jgi:DNA-binding protein YbaB